MSAIDAEKSRVLKLVAELRAETIAKLKKLGYGTSSYGHTTSYSSGYQTSSYSPVPSYGHSWAQVEEKKAPVVTHHTSHHGSYAVHDPHAEIKAIVAEFDAKLDAKAAAFDEFVAGQRQILEDAIAAEKAALAASIANEKNAFEAAAAEAREKLAKHKKWRLQQLDVIIHQKLAWMEQVIWDLKKNFSHEFIDTIA